MTNIAIEAKGLEPNWRVLTARGVEVDLTKPEQVEVIDQERGEEHDRPSGPEDRVQKPATNRISDLPEDGGNRPPLPEEEAEEETAYKHIGAPLDRRRDEPCPPSLETRPGHDAVWDGKEAQEQGVDEESEGGRAPHARINRLGDEEITDEANRVQERGEEDEITCDTIGQGQASAHSATVERSGRVLRRP